MAGMPANFQQPTPCLAPSNRRTCPQQPTLLRTLFAPGLPFPFLPLLQVAQLRREAARLRELTTQRDSLAEERQQLQSSLTAAVQRAERAEAEVATLRVRWSGRLLVG